MGSLLVRVGADQSPGGGFWNGPVNSRSNEFVYVPIPETKSVRTGLEKPYSALLPVLSKYGVALPVHLREQNMHLDPDFDYLTYGDQGERAKQLRTKLQQGDMIVFYAGLRDMQEHRLIYAIIGLFIVKEIMLAANLSSVAWGINAHSRRNLVDGAEDLIVRAQPKVSGRLQRCIPIGELRNRVYRVRNDLLDAWGGLDIKDGYIHRSARLPAFRDAAKFHRWFQAQKPELVAENNPA
jgi:hypothetical protein